MGQHVQDNVRQSRRSKWRCSYSRLDMKCAQLVVEIQNDPKYGQEHYLVLSSHIKEEELLKGLEVVHRAMCHVWQSA